MCDLFSFFSSVVCSLWCCNVRLLWEFLFRLEGIDISIELLWVYMLILVNGMLWWNSWLRFRVLDNVVNVLFVRVMLVLMGLILLVCLISS